MAALASLTANYTDSEEEDESNKHDADVEPENRETKLLYDRLQGVTPTTASSTNSARSTPTKKTVLVSYAEEDNDITKSDAEDHDSEPAPSESEKEDDVISMELDSENNGEFDDEEGGEAKKEEGDEVGDKSADVSERQEKQAVEPWSGGVQLPPEPRGVCQASVQESINKMYEKKLLGYDLNKVIQNKKSFRNPSIYEKLIQFCEIDEHGTNFPKELYDGHLFGKESYYEQLAKVQVADMERREKAAAKKAAAKQMVLKSEGKKDDGTAAKRKSKWDQAGPPAKTISAFGPLKK